MRLRDKNPCWHRNVSSSHLLLCLLCCRQGFAYFFTIPSFAYSLLNSFIQIFSSPPFPFRLSSIFSSEEGREGPNTSPNCQINVLYTGGRQAKCSIHNLQHQKTVFRVVIVRINIVFVASLRWQQTKHFFALFIILHVFRVQSVNLISLG